MVNTSTGLATFAMCAIVSLLIPNELLFHSMDLDDPRIEGKRFIFKVDTTSISWYFISHFRGNLNFSLP